jgi:hypothetical protein
MEELSTVVGARNSPRQNVQITNKEVKVLIFLGFQTLQDGGEGRKGVGGGPIIFPEMPVRNCHYLLYTSPEDRSSLI